MTHACPTRRSSDLVVDHHAAHGRGGIGEEVRAIVELGLAPADQLQVGLVDQRGGIQGLPMLAGELAPGHRVQLLVERGEHAIERPAIRSEEHTSELQSLMRSSYAVFCLKKKNNSL